MIFLSELRTGQVRNSFNSLNIDICLLIQQHAYPGEGADVDIRPKFNKTVPWSKAGSNHQDVKSGFLGTGPSAGEISFIIDIKNSDFVWLYCEYCGGNPFGQAVFLLDVNAAANVLPNMYNNGTIYAPSAERLVWTKVTKMGNDGMHLIDLPKGKHVLSILNNHTNSSPKNANSGLTQIILWP